MAAFIVRLYAVNNPILVSTPVTIVSQSILIILSSVAVSEVKLAAIPEIDVVRVAKVSFISVKLISPIPRAKLPTLLSNAENPPLVFSSIAPLIKLYPINAPPANIATFLRLCIVNAFPIASPILLMLVSSRPLLALVSTEGGASFLSSSSNCSWFASLASARSARPACLSSNAVCSDMFLLIDEKRPSNLSNLMFKERTELTPRLRISSPSCFNLSTIACVSGDIAVLAMIFLLIFLLLLF